VSERIGYPLPKNLHITNGTGTRSFVEVNSYSGRSLNHRPEVPICYSDERDIAPVIRACVFMRAIITALQKPKEEIQFIDFRLGRK
jgi:hypothetical protein